MENNLTSICIVAFNFRQNVKCFTSSYQRKKPNFFLTLICFKNVRKHRRSKRKLLGAILCKIFPSPQSFVWELFEISDFVESCLKSICKKENCFHRSNWFWVFQELRQNFDFQQATTSKIYHFFFLWTTVCKLKLTWEKLFF